MSLAYDLLVSVGGIQPKAFLELQKALHRNNQGLANGLMNSMNAQIEKSLNLAHRWSQDQKFRLEITARDFDVVFTIRDRTGSEYSFDERSSGLKYFLSYLVQFLIHKKNRKGSGILLMDEPDAYLSNQGQQDLVRILREFTLPDGSISGGQVLYVTHSPFLIDKNRADRIRVLDKGSDDEGVRVVHDIGRNHFEPLRTAMGSFVGETTFIGNCNLLLEGVSDQIYLAGMSELLGKRDYASTEHLDLNHITLVPVGSASNMPYMTYLARGRDTKKPAVIVLLDGDEDGDAAVKTLGHGGPRKSKLIHPEFISQLKPKSIKGVTSDHPDGPRRIEDLIPVEIALKATEKYLEEVYSNESNELPSVETINALLAESKGVFDALQKGISKSDIQITLSKIGFARHAIAVCEEEGGKFSTKMQKRFAALFSHLTKLQRKADREREVASISDRVSQERRMFLRRVTEFTTKADVDVFLERVEDTVDESIEGDQTIENIRRIRRTLELDKDPNNTIEDLDTLKRMVDELQYTDLLASQTTQLLK